MFSKILVTILFLVTFSAITLRPAQDADLGWHLKLGEQVSQGHGIPRENTWSTGLPGHKWVNVSWGTDVFEYWLFKTTGFVGLSIASTLGIIICLLILSRTFPASIPATAFTWLMFTWANQTTFILSFRAQIVSGVCLALLLYFLTQIKDKPITKYYFFIPTLLFVWANTHGSFLIGLGLLFLWLTTTILRQPLSKLVLFILSSLATLINPYGRGIYLESTKHFFSSDLPKIIEWVSPLHLETVAIPLIFWTTLFLTGALVVILKRDKTYIPILFLGFVLLCLSWSSIKYVQYSTIFSYPVILAAWQKFSDFLPKLSYRLAILLLLLVFIVNTVFMLPKSRFWDMNWSRYCTDFYLSCSNPGAKFIISHHLQDNLLAEYNFGSWLIWNYPEIKPFVDGRMHMWQENDYSPFKYYYGLESSLPSIDNSKFNTVFITRRILLYPELLKLEAEGKWKQVYSDTQTVVFTRNLP